jgi:hypothetical protein
MYNTQHFCPILTKFGDSGKIFVEVTHISFHKNPSSRSRADTRKYEPTQTLTMLQTLTETQTLTLKMPQTEGHMKKLTSAFRDFVNASKNQINNINRIQ